MLGEALILHGIEVLKEGLIRRIGNGEETNVWSDPWLPRDDARKPVTPKGNTLVQKVAELINQATGGWDEELITDIFWPQDAQCILSLPLVDGFEDSWAWHFDAKGQFSVKTAYHMLRDKQKREARRQVGEASAGTDEFEWKEIWKCECPNRVKQFVWRVAHKSAT